MRTFVFEAEQPFARPPEEVFPFFAEARNLQAITPPWLAFEVLTPAPIVMAAGTLIDYRLRWRLIPLPWRTEITAWQPPHLFVDEQVRGPYRLWRHEHRFEKRSGGTVMSDRVEYAVPGGTVINWLLVARDVARIFTYRRQVLGNFFPPR